MMNTQSIHGSPSFEQGLKDYLDTVNWDRFNSDADYKRGVLIRHQKLRHRKAGLQL